MLLVSGIAILFPQPASDAFGGRDSQCLTEKRPYTQIS